MSWNDIYKTTSLRWNEICEGRIKTWIKRRNEDYEKRSEEKYGQPLGNIKKKMWKELSLR